MPKRKQYNSNPELNYKIKRELSDQSVKKYKLKNPEKVKLIQQSNFKNWKKDNPEKWKEIHRKGEQRHRIKYPFLNRKYKPVKTKQKGHYTIIKDPIKKKEHQKEINKLKSQRFRKNNPDYYKKQPNSKKKTSP